MNSFTYSKAIDNVGQVLEGTNGGSPNPQDFYNPNNDKGPSSFDQRFNNTTSIVYALPFGHGKRYGSAMPGVLEAIAGGWEASSIINLQSGQPLNLRYGDTDGRLSDGQADFLGNVALRPNVVDPAAGILAPDGQRTYDNYFNRANIVIPAATSPFGNIGRNAVYGYASVSGEFDDAEEFRSAVHQRAIALDVPGGSVQSFQHDKFHGSDDRFA